MQADRVAKLEMRSAVLAAAAAANPFDDRAAEAAAAARDALEGARGTWCTMVLQRHWRSRAARRRRDAALAAHDAAERAHALQLLQVVRCDVTVTQ